MDTRQIQPFCLGTYADTNLMQMQMQKSEFMWSRLWSLCCRNDNITVRSADSDWSALLTRLTHCF